MHTIVIINPGHFHAGLVLREMHPRLSEHVYIYSEPGQDLDNYLKLIKSFNQREQNPTRWQPAGRAIYVMAYPQTEMT